MIKFFIFFFFVSLLSPQLQSQNLPRNMNIFILAGQSNMAGRGGVYNNTATNTTIWDGIVPQECQSNPSIFRFTGKLEWEEAKEPLHVDIDVNKTNGVGPGMPFANRMVKELGEAVGLVPCAIGGTKISEWQKGEFLYEETVRRAKAAAAAAAEAEAGQGGSYKAVLWYQGESDTEEMVDALVYKQRLSKFFKDLRDDLDNPNLAIIQVAVATGSGPYLDAVRKAQLETELKNVHCVDAKGLPLEPGGLHLTTSSQVKLGLMMAEAFMAIPIPNSAHPSSSPFLHILFFSIYFLNIFGSTFRFL